MISILTSDWSPDITILNSDWSPDITILTSDWSPDITILTSDWPGPAPAPGPGEERGAAAGDRAERRAGEVEHGGAGVQRVQEVDREIVDSRQSPMKQNIIGNKE